MQKTIEILGQTIEYTFKQSARSRGVRLAIHADGRFVVTASPRVSVKRIDQFIQTKAAWITQTTERVAKAPKKQTLGEGTRREYLQQRKEVLALATDRLKHFNQIYGFKYKKITIRNTKSRWGSCSRKGNISFVYKILFLTPEQSDYIIVHELCHLGAFNHSKKFWDLVAKTMPNHREIRRSLKKFTLS